MEKQGKRETEGRKPEDAGRERVVRRPITAEERAELMKAKPKWSCHDCVFCISSVWMWAQTLASGFPITGMCANHPDTPGQMRPVPHGGVCRNFQAKSRLDRAAPVPPNPKVRYITLTRGLHALVDAEDYEWLNRYKWHVSPSISHSTVYAKRSVGHNCVFMHRMIMQPPKGMVVDHINGNGLDNRRCNLRICTREENAQNRRKHVDGKSRFIGVSPCGNKWQAFVGHEYVGHFDDEVEAAKARDRKARELYGEHAWLNFPPESPPEERQ
jgi:hypothetical protein